MRYNLRLNASMLIDLTLQEECAANATTNTTTKRSAKTKIDINGELKIYLLVMHAALRYTLIEK